MESRLRMLEDWVRDARPKGAAGLELLHCSWVGHHLATERGQVVSDQEDSGENLVVRAWLKGGARGEATGSIDAIESLMDQAIAAAADREPDAYAGPVDRLTGTIGGLSIADRRFPHLASTDRVDVLATGERAAKALDRRILLGRFAYRDRRLIRAYASTRGVGLEEASTEFEVSGRVELSGSGFEVESRMHSRSFSSIASLPFGSRAGQIAVALGRGGETLDGPVRVLLRSEAVAAIVDALAESLTGGPTFLFPSDGDRPVLDSRLHIVDDGALVGGLRSASFDDRGVRPRPLVLLKDGVPEERYISLQHARRLETLPTGHQQGDRRAPRNLLVRAGTRSVSATLGDLGGVVFSIEQLHDRSGLNLATGEVDIEVRGLVLRNGEVVGAVPSGRLRGRLQDVFSQLVQLCSDTDRIGHVDAPAVVVDGFTLST